MREIDQNTLDALTGSRPGDKLVCWLWYDGMLMREDPLPVSSWSLSWDGDDRQKIQGTLTMEINDPDGELGPWLLDDPLGVGGSWIQALYLVGGAGEVKMGRFRVTGNDVDESWSFQKIREDGYVVEDSDLAPHYRTVSVSRGSSLSVTAQEMTVEIDSDEFLAPEQPQGTNPSVMAEVERLVGDILPVVWRGVTDEPVPKESVWEQNRMEAVMDLLAMVNASHRMSGEGDLECYVKDPTPVFLCEGGDDGILIGFSRSQSLARLANSGIVLSTQKIMGADGVEVEVPIRGVYEITTGPLRVGGPAGRRVIRNDNPLMNTQAKATLAAKSLVLNRLNNQTDDVSIQCLPNPAVQIGDYGTVVVPVRDGRQVPLSGEVVSVSLGGSGGGVNAMQLTLRCRSVDIASALKNHSITDNLTGVPPESTWENINPLRTWSQMSQPWNEEG